MSDVSTPSPADTPPVGERGTVERQQCWECRRRRLVCDGTQPVCTKCRAARIVCPGYADKKPLTWLAPGQVMSRARRKKACPRKSGTRPAVPAPKKQQKSETTNRSESSSSEDSGDNPIDEIEILMRPVELRPEVCDVFEAMTYYNALIYPEMEKHQLGRSPFVIPMIVLQGIPQCIVHTLVSVTISHRIIRLAEEPASNKLVKPLWTRLYRHRDIAVRTINRLVNDEATQKSMTTIFAVYTLLFAMLQHSFTPCWRTHIGGFMSLVHLRGISFRGMIEAYPDLELSLMALCIVGVLANSTTARDKQTEVTPTDETLHLIETYYSEVYYPHVSCPKELFLEIIHINDLRLQPPSPETTETANSILSRLESFSPETWSSTRPAFQDDWRLLSTIFHATITLYAILSLQSSNALSRSSPELELARARHARTLFGMLEDAMAAPRVRKRMIWPLVVAGVEAQRASAEVQWYIAERLAEMGRDHGCAPPLVARAALERFWAGGGGLWDECFEEPLALVL